MFQSVIPWYADMDYWWEVGYEKFEPYISPVLDIKLVAQSYRVVESVVYPKSLRRAIGGGMIILGTAILIPGPIDVAVAGLGYAIAGPVGAAVGVGLYNTLGVVLVVGGVLISL